MMMMSTSDDAANRDLRGMHEANAEARKAREARSRRLLNLATGLDTDATREKAIDALETVKRAHEPPPAEPWVKRL